MKELLLKSAGFRSAPKSLKELFSGLTLFPIFDTEMASRNSPSAFAYFDMTGSTVWQAFGWTKCQAVRPLFNVNGIFCSYEMVDAMTTLEQEKKFECIRCKVGPCLTIKMNASAQKDGL